MKIRNYKLASRFLCLSLMLLVILLVYTLKIPNPMMILIIPVVYFTYSDGYANGVLSGSMAIIYSVYFFLMKTADPAGMVKIITIVLAVSTIILLIGRLKARDEKNAKELGRVNDLLMLMATTDKLTGAPNRYDFFNKASVVYDHSMQMRSPLSILFIDVDHFKQVNDIFGHLFGDGVLVRLWEIIHKCLRDNDLCCRYGGEEFVVLLLRSDCNTAQFVAQRIMREVRQAHFQESPDFHFSVSIGISSGTPSPPHNLDDYIKTADNAMYLAKSAGRDCIILSEI
jgi:diguanylate cyclase (GGDEF)-like protein